jgi:hypothetical protein
LDFNTKKVSCDLSKTCEHVIPVTSAKKLSHVSKTLRAKKGVVSCLYNKNWGCVGQKFGQEFSICAQKNKTKFHNVGETYKPIDFVKCF